MSRSGLDVLGFRLQAWRRRAGNFSLIRHRHCDGYLVSMHQSGTHWLKFMLANALSRHYGIPPPRYNHANDIIGGPRDSPVYPGPPRIISSHSIAHPLLEHAAVHQLLRLPPFVLLVRDLRTALVSNFMKWRARYGVGFSEYLRGDRRGVRFNSDLWWTLRFLNAWGAVAARVPGRILVVRYEDLQRDALAGLMRVNEHLGLALGTEDLRHGVASASKAQMQAKDDPARPPGAVRTDADDAPAVFAAADRRYVEAVCADYLRYDFGYDYRAW